MARSARRSAVAAGSPTGAFFEALASRGTDPLLRTANGSIRFDVVDRRHVEHWLVSVNAGNAKVSRVNRRADAVMLVEKELLDRIVSGRANAMAALLRGALVVEGDLGLLLAFQRIFPGPQSPARPTAAARGGGRG